MKKAFRLLLGSAAVAIAITLIGERYHRRW